jgi:hypothetical protein
MRTVLALTFLALLAGPRRAGAQTYWEVEGLAALSRVPIGALPGIGLDGPVMHRGRGVARLGATAAGEILGTRLNVAASWYSPRANGSSRTLTLGATGGCEGCARGLMIGDERTRTFRGPGPDSSRRTWITGSMELGLGRAMQMTPVGMRLVLAAIRVGLPLGAALSISPGVTFGGYLYPSHIVKPELGKAITGGVLKSLRVGTSLPVFSGRRITVGGHHLFVPGARTTIGLSYAW